MNWSLAKGSSGSLTTNSSTLATYTAPASIAAQEAVGGCQVMPNDAVYNTPIDNLPVESRSSLWTANIGANGIGFLASWGTNIADATTPVKSMSFFYTPLYNGPFVMPQWPSLKREGGTFTTRLNDTDHHIVTVRRDNCQFYETYNDYFVPATCRDGVTPGCNAQSGLAYSWNTYALPVQGSTDAAGLPLLPLTLRLSEIKSGVVNHAVRFTLSAGFIQALAYGPANSTNGCKSRVNSPPYGARFRLKASYDISKFSPTAQVILTALKRYGMFLADVGLGPTIVTDTDVSEDSTVVAALNEITSAGIITNNFEAVDESSLMASNTSVQVNPANTYQTPSNYAAIQAVDQTNSNYQVNLPIPLQSVLVGLPSPTMVIVAGMSGYQLESWVNGTTNQNVTWSLVSGTGSVTPAGVYTPPASVTAPTSAVLQATSAADTSAFSKLYVTVIPTGANPAGSIRIDSGSGTGLTDGSGNLWLPELGYEYGGYNGRGGDYPNWASLANNPENYVYQSAAYTYGFDMVYKLVVPNGNYKVRDMFGQIYNGCNNSSCVTYNPNNNVTSHWPLHIEANGQIALHNFNWGLPTNYAYATPIDVFIPAKVVDYKLYTAIRINLPDVITQASPLPMINGVEIIPDNNTTPYLAIDTQQQTNVAAGSTLQLYSVGWYMSNAVTWSISGPGSIDQNGLYTAPATPGSAQTVTVTATSTTNPTVNATTSLTIPASGS